MQVAHWSGVILETRKRLGGGSRIDDLVQQGPPPEGNILVRNAKLAHQKYKRQKEIRALRQQILDIPVGSSLPPKAVTKGQPVQPPTQQRKPHVKLEKLNVEPWLEEFLDSSRLY